MAKPTSTSTPVDSIESDTDCADLLDALSDLLAEVATELLEGDKDIVEEMLAEVNTKMKSVMEYINT